MFSDAQLLVDHYKSRHNLRDVSLNTNLALLPSNSVTPKVATTRVVNILPSNVTTQDKKPKVQAESILKVAEKGICLAPPSKTLLALSNVKLETVAMVIKTENKSEAEPNRDVKPAVAGVSLAEITSVYSESVTSQREETMATGCGNEFNEKELTLSETVTCVSMDSEETDDVNVSLAT